MLLQTSRTISKAGQARTKTRVVARVFGAFCWGYLLLVLGLIVVLRTQGDRIVLVTLLLFSPRWVWLSPLLILLPLAILFHRRALIILGLAAAIGIFPLMGFSLGLHRYLGSSVGMPIRVMAFNVHQNDLSDPAVERFLQEVHPDVVGLEESPPQLNPRLFPARDWHCVRDGEQFIASRYPIVSQRDILGGVGTICILDTPGGRVQIIVVHLASPHYALRDSIIHTPDGDRELMLNIVMRRAQAETLASISAATDIPLIIAGDFNLVPDSRLFDGQFPTMVDSFEAVGWGFGWTYRNEWTVLRLDHVLSNAAFDPLRCVVGPFLGSPHQPIIADLMLKEKLK